MIFRLDLHFVKRLRAPDVLAQHRLERKHPRRRRFLPKNEDSNRAGVLKLVNGSRELVRALGIKHNDATVADGYTVHRGFESEPRVDRTLCESGIFSFAVFRGVVILGLYRDAAQDFDRL